MLPLCGGGVISRFSLSFIINSFIEFALYIIHHPEQREASVKDSEIPRRSRNNWNLWMPNYLFIKVLGKELPMCLVNGLCKFTQPRSVILHNCVFPRPLAIYNLS